MKGWLNRFHRYIGKSLTLPQRFSASIQPTPLDQARFAVLDIETTGLDPQTDEILALGAIRMIGSRILVGQTFDQLVQPAQTDWGNTVPIHRILPEDVKTAPALEAVIGPFARFCAGHVLVGHSVWLDRVFLVQAGAFNTHLWLDITRIAKWLFAQNSTLPRPDLPLFSLAQAYDVPVPVRHQALADAFITAQIWQRQLSQIQSYGLTYLDHVVPLMIQPELP